MLRAEFRKVFCGNCGSEEVVTVLSTNKYETTKYKNAQLRCEECGFTSSNIDDFRVKMWKGYDTD